MIDTQLFRKAMGEFATGITVVSANDKHGEVKGITAFMSLSLDPTLVAVSISNKASIIQTLADANQFGISVLSDQQKELSMIFAKQKEADQPVPFDILDETPVLKDALVQLVCEKESEVEAGDHTIYIAKVKELQVQEGQPIIYYGGSYQYLK